mgnify:CR=1 FL=1
MTMLDIKNNVTRTFYKAGFQLKKHSPEILIVTGVVGVVTSAVMACKASTQVGAVIEGHKTDVADFKEIKELEAFVNDAISKKIDVVRIEVPYKKAVEDPDKKNDPKSNNGSRQAEPKQKL